MSKRDFFDPKFENAIMNIRVSALEDENKVLRKNILWIFGTLAVLLGAFAGGLTAKQEKLEARIVALEEENQRRDCQQDAEAVGAGYVFVAKGAESECYPLYSE